jgi:Zn ribbon nucleic-acid-binding protein
MINLAGKSVEGKSMERSLNMEPYPALYSDDSFIQHSAQVLKEANLLNDAEEAAPGVAALNAIPGVGEVADVGEGAALGAGALAEGAEDVLPEAANLAGKAWGGVKDFFGGIFGGGAANAGKMVGQGGEFQEGKNLIGDGQGGGGAAAAPAAPPSAMDMGTYAFVLESDYETPSSLPSVGLAVGDPTRTDQHELNDGSDESRIDNPMWEDSGASGEDQVRQQAGFGPSGFSPNSPALQMLEQKLPLIQHYMQNDPEGARNDPELQRLHEALMAENPDYLNPNAGVPERWTTHHHQTLGVHANVPSPQNMVGVGTTPVGVQSQGGGLGTCPSCGGQTNNGVCPTCVGNNQAAAPGAGAGIPGILGANHQGPVTPEQIAAVQQLLIQQGRVGELPNVPLNPQNYAREMDSISNDPNAAPQVQPDQIVQPPAPPQGPPGMGGPPPGGDPSQDPSQGGAPPGGMPPGMSSVTAADNVARRCPNCGSGTTGLADGDTGTCVCHSCSHQWVNKDIKGQPVEDKLARVSEDLMAINPDTQPASERGHLDHHQEQPQDSSLTWQDANGDQIVPGKEYEMHNPAYQVPDVVKVVFVHPNEIGLKLVGEFSNAFVGDNTPDIKLTQQRFKMDNLSFIPSQQPQQQQEQPPTGGFNVQDDVPPASQTTTDQFDSSYPDHQSSAREASVVETDKCPACGDIDITHTYSSANREMHECYRCGKAWETAIEDYGHEASIDLSWLNESEDDDFGINMERAAAMRSAGTETRNIGDIAARDSRLAEIRDRLSRNKQEAAEFLRTAGRKHTPSEQRALIDEQGLARNSDLLDLSGTHYLTRFDTTGKANGDNVPDSHLLMGI